MVHRGTVCGGPEPYRRVVGASGAPGHAPAMTRGLGRIGSLAAALALALAIASIGPAAAADPPKRAWNAEKYALSLLNCTRTGGWVKANGTCVARGSGKHSTYRRPLRRHTRISTRVAFPWARNMVTYNVCGHSIAGKPNLGRRMARAGFKYPYYGENVGCGWGWGRPKDVVLMAHRAFQAEKSARGGHWRNIKNRGYKSVGIGVATRNGVTMVVYDFYGKRY